MKYIVLIFAILSVNSYSQKVAPPLEIKEIAKNVFLHTSYKYIEGYGLVDSNGLVIVKNSRAVIIDTPWSETDTENLISWITSQGLNIRGSVSTHFHEDRTAGIQLLNSKSIPTYASKLTNKILSSEKKPTAKHSFDPSEFTMLSELLETFYPGEGHTKDNIVIWLPEHSILFGGCLVRSLEWNSLGYIGDASVDHWAESILKIQSKYRQIKTVIPGHGKLAGIEVLDHTLKLAKNAE